ncbi:MAG: ABC transporter ATP-binding protein [Vicinamibacteria bacterium]|nr:ABC transporter ATP-binding protein [Vicinamibacteria bacterium]
MFASEALRIAGVSKSYGRLLALDGVSFSIRPGEVLGLIGPNGAGKTTLFECLAGVLPPGVGTRLSHEQAFYLPDAITPWPAQTVRWGLDFVVGFLGGRASLRDEVIVSLALEPLLASRIGELSKGQRKRALLAMGLLAPQPLLLVDEPFDGLDLRQSREVAATLRAHAKGGRTLFLSIHQIADAARLCDRFVLLSEGRVRGEGTLDELKAAAASREPASGAGRPPADLEEVFLALT